MYKTQKKKMRERKLHYTVKPRHRKENAWREVDNSLAAPPELSFVGSVRYKRYVDTELNLDMY